MGRSLRSPSVPLRTSRIPRQTKQISLRVSEAIRERILTWRYPPNHHLNERELCDEFSASRIPVREALNVLVEQGLVQRVPNQGCYVKQPDLRAVHELYDLRLALELFVVEQLSRLGAPAGWLQEERTRWEPLLEPAAAAAVQSADLLKADEAFHLGLAGALDNAHIIEALSELYARIRFVRLTVSTNPDRVRTTATDHLEILDAVTRHDAAAARHALWRNIDEARNKVEAALSKALSGAVWSRGRPELTAAG